MSGAANEVPLRRPKLPDAWGAGTQTATPGAVTSGLVRPSAVGPRELNAARAPVESSAPTATTESPSAGVDRVCWPGPSLPAEGTTVMPRWAALAAGGAAPGVAAL